MNCDESDNIFNSLNNSLQDSLYSQPNIIRITLFCVLKITDICDFATHYLTPDTPTYALITYRCAATVCYNV